MFFNHFCAEFIEGNIKYNSLLFIKRIKLIYNGMFADDMTTHGAGASVAMILA